MEENMHIVVGLLAGFTLLASTQAYARKGVIGSLVGAAIGSAVGKAAGSSLSSKDVQLDEPTLQKVAEYINQRLPMTTDADTRADSTLAGPGKKFTYLYTIKSYSSAEIDPVAFSREMTPEIRNMACSAPDLQLFYQKGVTLVYSYRGNDGRFIGKIEITPAACGHRS
jgi:hypothetical protein